MQRNTKLWIVIGILAIASIFLLIHLGSGSVAHQATRSASGAANAASAMVGSC